MSDFGREELVQKAVVPKTPDEFLCSLCDENPDLVYASTRQAQANLTKSAPTWSAYLEILSERNRLREFVRRLKQFEDENK